MSIISGEKNLMKILLVYPEFPVTFWSFTHALKFINKKASLPPLGILTVAAMLPKEWNLKLLIADMAGEDFTQLILKKEAGRRERRPLQADESQLNSSIFGLVLGNEGGGVSKEIYSLNNTKIKIPMTNEIESLNVAVAGGILMYYFFVKK